MLDLGVVRAISGHTFKEAIRAKWLLMFTTVFFLLAINIPFLVLLFARYLPPNYLDVYLTYLITLSFPFLPLLALPMGAVSIVDDRESGVLQYMLSNPISKTEYFLGRYSGLLFATSAVIVLGYGIAAAVSYNVSAARYLQVTIPMAVGIALNASMLALALVASILTKRKATALGAAIFAWFLFTVLSNLGFLSIVISLSLSQQSVISLVLLNPIETARILAVQLTGGGISELGTTGLVVQNTFGKSSWIVLMSGLMGWAVGATAICFLLFRRRDPV
jgi:ABC-type transport system involved in multi-copper enzyme maturation permease subunit